MEKDYASKLPRKCTGSGICQHLDEWGNRCTMRAVVETTIHETENHYFRWIVVKLCKEHDLADDAAEIAS